MPAKNLPSDEDIIDLTELIESGDASTPARGAKAYSSVSQNLDPADADVDFEAILQATEKKDTASPVSSASSVDAHEQLDMSVMGEIDNLLESLDIPTAAGARKAPKAAAAAEDDFELPSESPAKAPNSAHKDENFGIGEESPDDKGDFADLDSVLDDLLGEPPAQPTANNPPATPVAPKPQNKIVDLSNDLSADLSADLDDILAAADTSSFKEERMEETETVIRKEAIPDLELNLPDEDKPANSGEKEAATHDESALDEVDQLFADMDLRDESREKEKGGLESTSEIQDTFTRQSADENFLVRKSGDESEASAINDLSANDGSASPAISQQVFPVQAQVYNTEDIISGILKNILPSQNSMQDKLQEYAREIGEQNGLLKNLVSQMENLQTRLHTAETELASANTRIASLETALKEKSSLEDLFQDGSQIQKGFLELVSSSVANAMGAFKKDNDEIQALASQLESLDAREKSVSDRMDLLEKLVDSMKTGFSRDVENAAAKAVTAILHEEISRLMSES